MFSSRSHSIALQAPPLDFLTLRVRTLLWLFVIALLTRSAWGMYRYVQSGEPGRLEFPDEQQYWMMAQSLRDGEGLRDELGFLATRMPFFPSFLALFAPLSQGILLVRIAHWIIGAVGAVLTAGAATVLLGRRVGWLAGLIVAVDPFLVFFSSLLLTETLFVTLLAAFWWLVAPFLRGGPVAGKRWLAVAVISVSLVYVRESALMPLMAALLMTLVVRRFESRTVYGAAFVAVFVATALVPWAMRNRRILGERCWLTTRGGISLYDGVGPQATGASDLGEVKAMPEVRLLSESEWNRYFLQASWDSIRSDPRRIVRLAAVKLARTWNPFPNVGEYQAFSTRLVSACWMLSVYGLAMAGVVLLAIQCRAAGVILTVYLLLPAVSVSLLHCFFVGSVRYRLPAHPMLEILAAVAMIALLDSLRRPRTALPT